MSRAVTARVRRAVVADRRASEDLGAPRRALGREHRVRARGGASAQLLDPPATHELREREAAEVRASRARSRRGGAAAADGRPLRAAAREPPACRRSTGRTRRRRRTRPCRRRRSVARGQRRADVDEPHPEPVADARPHAPRRREEPPERMVDRQQARRDPRRPVDVEEVAPDLGRRPAVERDRLDDLELGVRDLPPSTSACAGRSRSPPAARRARGRRSASGLRPRRRRPAARRGCGAPTSCASAPSIPGVLRRTAFQTRGKSSSASSASTSRTRSLALERPRERRVLPSGSRSPRTATPSRSRSARRSCPRRPTAGRAARRARGRRRAARASSTARTPRRRCVGNVPTTVTPARRHDAAGNGQLERECAGAADDDAVLAARVHALDREVPREALHALLGRLHPEVLADREDRLAELLEVARRAATLKLTRSSPAVRTRPSAAARFRPRRSAP